MILIFLYSRTEKGEIFDLSINANKSLQCSQCADSADIHEDILEYSTDDKIRIKRMKKMHNAESIHKIKNETNRIEIYFCL